MTDPSLLQRFTQAATAAGAVVVTPDAPDALLDYLASHLAGPLLLPDLPVAQHLALAARLRGRGCTVIDADLRTHAPSAAAGLTGADFAIAETGTLVIDSTAEAIRLASTLPPIHFVLLDPSVLVTDGLAAVPPLRRLQQHNPASFLAYVTGPSRTADIERVLTIGVHGPKELHILMVAGLALGDRT